VLLRHVADAAADATFGRLGFDRRAVETDRAGGRRQLAEQGLEQGRLARPVAAEHRDRTLRRGLERHAEQRLAAAVARAQAVDLEEIHVRHGS
jgi:hypothetical protein